jgi:hypothetical protein
VRCDEKQLWKKCGGILFQSYSKGDEQRIVFGIGINMTAESLRPGQGGLEEIHVTSSISSLFTTLNAVVASLFEEKTAIQLPPPEHEIRLESLLKNVFYRNNEYVLESVSDQGIGIVDSSGIRHVIETHDELSWTNLEPQ